jgi:Domain of unknown function (DUF6457)
MHPWLEDARDRLATSTGDDPSRYELGEDDIERLLDLARVAAHDSGDRRNAPLVCYLAGIARGRHDRELGGLVDGLTTSPD